MIDWPALEAANAPLNAFVDWDKTATGGTGPLAGITVGVKANIAVKGLPWSAGMALYRNRIAERDAKVVADLRAAGAIIIGTLNMEEAALGAKTDNPWFGATYNPHRIGHSPGGSSGGSAAAVAAGLCDVALGSDTMGSVRIPASYCGVYGFKPANAAISQEGLEIAEASLDVIGPIARSLEMLERTSRIISDVGKGAAQRNIAILADFGGVDCQAIVIKRFNEAKVVLGVKSEFALVQTLSRIRFAGFIATSRAMATHFAGADPTKLSDTLKALLAYGPRRSDADWAEDQAILAETRTVVQAAIAKHGFILLPTAPQTAFPHSEAAPANQADFTCLANIAGLPAISIPAGWSDDGLPIGMQIIGAVGDEAGLFAIAKTLDDTLAAYRPPALFLT